MICSKCQELGLKSKVYLHGTTTTLMGCEPFYDEEGKYHIHDMNQSRTRFSCSKSHSGIIKASRTQCPSCDFGNEPKIFEYD